MKKETLLTYHLPRYHELPELDLYMDQLLSYLESHILCFGKDRITKTMINNYVKHGIVKAPVKKRYDRKHIAYFLVVFLLKRVYTMEEISKLIQLQIDTYDIERAYDFFCEEFENCLVAILSGEPITHTHSCDEGSKTVMLLRSTIQSITYRLCVDLFLEEG